MDKLNNKKNNTTPVWLKILRTTGWTLLLLYFPVAFYFVHKERASQRVINIVADVHNDGQNVLITEKGLRSIINRQFPDLKGSLLSEVDFNNIEDVISRSSVVSRCEAYPTMDGSVHIEIYQRKPIMRVFASSGSYYMDADGFKVVAIPGMLSHVVIVTGNVNSMLNTDNLVALCRFISSDPFWRSMIEQINVSKNHEYVLIPRVGDHIIEFGNIDNYIRKFQDLKVLYTKGWTKTEWNVYKKVCLKYDGQIVCTKR